MSNNPNPIRCFDGNAKPHQPFWQWVNVNQETPELQLYGLISEYSWLGDEITPKMFKDELYKIGNGGPVKVRINSQGGDVIAASVMRAIMTEYPGEITVQIDGIAASAAVEVAMSGKHIRIMDSAYMMIHDPAVIVMLATLDITTLDLLSEKLKSIKDGIVGAYSNRTGLKEEKISRMMADETWMSAREAVQFGFADEVIEGGQKAPPVDHAFVNVIQNYSHVPPALMQAFTQVNVPPADDSSDPDAADRERQTQSLRDRVTRILKKENPHA